MTAYYYKGSPILAPLSITSNQPVFSNDTVSLKQIRTAQNAQRWELTFNIATTDNAVEMLLAGCDNLANPATMIMPQLKEVADAHTAYDDFVANTAIEPVGETTINLTKQTGTGLIPKGSFVKFSNHTKIYVLKTDIDLDTFTSGDIEIYPSLRVELSIGSQMVTANEVLLSYFPSIDNAKGITYTDGRLASPGAITLIEAI